MAKRLSKTTVKQYEELLNFVRRNKIILSGKTNILDQKKIANLWLTFANHINALGVGPQKTSDQWRHVFNEWKTNTRRKSREIIKHQQGTGGGPHTPKTLTDLEEQLLALLSKIHLGDTAIKDSLDYQLASTSAQTPPQTNYSNNNIEISFEDESLVDSHQFGVDEEIIYLDVDDHDQQVQTPKDQLHIENNTLTNEPLEMERQTLSSDETPRLSKKAKLKKPDTGKSARNILQEATQNYERATLNTLESEKLKLEATQLIAQGIQDFAKAYKINSIATLKLEYYKMFKTFDGFENVYKDI